MATHYIDDLKNCEPSKEFTEKALRILLENNRQYQEQQAKKKEKPLQFFFSMPQVRFTIVGVCACLLIGFGILVAFQPTAESIVSLKANEISASVPATWKAGGTLNEAKMTIADFTARSCVDFTDLLSGFALQDADISAYFNDAGEIVGDLGAFTYIKDTTRIIVYASTTDQIAPPALINTKSVSISGKTVWLGQSEQGSSYFAAWIQAGTALYAQSNGLTRSEFIAIVKDALSK